MSTPVHKLIILVVLVAGSCEAIGTSLYCRPHVDPCLLPKHPGNCLGSTRRWYHDIADGICKEFTYSSCGGGNANNFGSQELCNFHCRYQPGNDQQWLNFHERIFGGNSNRYGGVNGGYDRNYDAVVVGSKFEYGPAQQPSYGSG